ncbi:MAG TPA: DUF6457 domain-containing protein [Streptosporangiaceae bacterium]|nr:DUF6457 domain-containing protein [Streptosporangiaceae bacterium]
MSTPGFDAVILTGDRATRTRGHADTGGADKPALVAGNEPDMTTLDNWTAAACEKLGIEVALVDIRQILGVARVAAHQVERPAAPLTAYLLGLAVGTGQPADRAAEQLAVLAEDWPTG